MTIGTVFCFCSSWSCFTPPNHLYFPYCIWYLDISTAFIIFFRFILFWVQWSDWFSSPLYFWLIIWTTQITPILPTIPESKYSSKLFSILNVLKHHPPPSENCVFSATEHRMNPRLVCKFEFGRCGPLEKKLERSICLSLVVATRQSRVGSKFQNLKILNFFASTKFYNKSRTPFLISSPNT